MIIILKFAVRHFSTLVLRVQVNGRGSYGMPLEWEVVINTQVEEDIRFVFLNVFPAFGMHPLSSVQHFNSRWCRNDASDSQAFKTVDEEIWTGKVLIRIDVGRVWECHEVSLGVM